MFRFLLGQIAKDPPAQALKSSDLAQPRSKLGGGVVSQRSLGCFGGSLARRACSRRIWAAFFSCRGVKMGRCREEACSWEHPEKTLRDSLDLAHLSVNL